MPIELALDDYDLSTFCELLSRPADGKFRYVVTPNVDHVIRYCDDPEFRQLYAQASHILLDSRVLACLLVLSRKLRAPVRVCTGSDLTAEIFARLLQPEDRVVLVGGTAQQATVLRQRFGLRHLQHIDPPMGFIRDAAAVEACLRAIEAESPFRFCFLAIGSPQQEMLAHHLKVRAHARGTALCIGASINFLTGTERRAPRWLQRLGLEWLYRLSHNPGRLAGRYLMRGPRIFQLLLGLDLTLRPSHDDCQR
jgi:N-acetylglucosaminyldiphosphoundecaprenol N-acetyl-beta-D-mannosaminyltransferase